MDRDEIQLWRASPVTKLLLSLMEDRKTQILSRLVGGGIETMPDYAKLVGEFRGLTDLQTMIEEIEHEGSASRREVGSATAQIGAGY